MIMCVMIYIKLLTQILIFLLVFLPSASAQQSTSTYFGFHSERIRAKQTSPVSINVTQDPDGVHFQTIEEMFGPENQVGLKSGDPDLLEPDIVWVAQRGFPWLEIYYNEGWKAIGFGDRDMGKEAPALNRGFFIESRREVDWYIIFDGYVKRDAMIYEIDNGLNVLNRGYPLSFTLNDSGIAWSSGFTWGDELTGDLIWLYNRDTEAEHYYFSGSTKRWHKVGSGDEDFGNESISATFAIMARGEGGEIIINTPAVLRRSKTISEGTSPVNPPPAPYIYTLLLNNNLGDPYFFALWHSYNFRVRYNTEVINPNSNSWITVDSQIGSVWWENPLAKDAIPQRLWTFASVRRARLGVGRVVAQWDSPPSKRF